MIEIGQTYLKTPVGWLCIKGSDQGITIVDFMEETPPLHYESAVPDIVEICKQQLEEYFEGSRKVFDIPVVLKGTEFQRNVWTHLLSLPFGKTVSYDEMARALGNPKSVRAVGSANGQNPVPVIVPCHRVIGADGNLVGYSGKQWRKQWLLDHEQKIISGQLEIF